jgi:outer membrane receptor protein involved in Fe transport
MKQRDLIDVTSNLKPSVSLLAMCIAAGTAVAQGDAVQFDIPEGEMKAALTAYINQSGSDLIYRTDQIDGVEAPGVAGTYSKEEALERLLAGTDFVSKRDASGAYMVVAANSPKAATRASSTRPAQAQRAARNQTVRVQATPAEPETTSTPEPEPVQDSQLRQDKVIVVGSQIVGLDSGGALPVSVVDSTDIDAIASVSGDDLFRSIPQMGDVAFNSTENVSGGINSARGDVASINLRALGTGNTLALLNGRRMVNHPGTQSENLVPVVSPNVNAIPVMGVSRVEVLLDGASALYGTDAVAGVVNTVLADDFSGFEAELRAGGEEGTDSMEYNFSFRAGESYNNGNTHVSLFGSYTDRDPVFASEKAFSANADLRGLLPESWTGDSQFNGTSSNSAWGAFTALDPVTGAAVSVPGFTNGSGGFHVQPDTEAGCLAPAGDGICYDDGNATSNVAAYYNVNDLRTISNGVERLNLFATLTNEFANGVEFFGEAGFYGASSEAQREASSQLTAERHIIPASNYYNPLGAVGSPNRLPGLNIPAGGLDIDLRRYRPVDTGPRMINVDNRTYRLLGGFRGEAGGYDWETAALISAARTEDVTNRLSNTLFQRALGLSTPDAYNPFNGGGLPLSENGDGTPSEASTFDDFTVDVYRISTTSLAMIDFKVSRPDLFTLPGGDVGMALGTEARLEEFTDERDPRLNGTIQFLGPNSGELTSDVMGSSPTLDSSGDREVFSAFAEFALPLVSEEMEIPFVQSLDLQIAGRYEHYNLFGSVAKPKVALAWRPADFLLVRSAWSEGFKAPNLQQQFQEDLERVNNRQDFIQCEADVRAGRIADFNACARTQAVSSQRAGNTDLGPEESENFTAGLVFDATFMPAEYGSLTLTADYWSIEQEDVVGIFGDDNHIVLDYLLRTRGSFNPAVVRAAPTAQNIADFAGTGLEPAGEILYVEDNYYNFLPRDVEGIDYAIYYDIDDTPAGDFSVKLNAAQLLTFNQDISSVEAGILAAQAAGEISDVANLSGVGDLIKQNGRPEWRFSGSLTWRMGPWGAGWFTTYVDEVFDTSATNDDTGEFWTVDSDIRHNAYVQYTLGEDGDKPLRLRVGARNVFDEEPPLAEESFGYLGTLHSPQGRFVYASVRKTF